MATTQTDTAPVSLAEPLCEGRRNTDLYRTGRSLRAKQLAPAAIASTLRTLNAEQCEPPLPAHELDKVIEQVCEQPDRSDFNGGLAPTTGGAEKSDEADAGKASKRSQAMRLVELALSTGVELFHDPERAAYATVPHDGHKETYPLHGGRVTLWLTRLFYHAEKTTPASSVLDDAKRALEGHAQFDGPEHPVQVRLAGHGDAVYLDLANDAWDVVEITANGWAVISDAPVRFRRPDGMYALPTPVPGGSLEELRPFLNASTEDDFCLCVSYLIGGLRPKGPYPAFVISGEQGTAKSTRARVLKIESPDIKVGRSQRTGSTCAVSPAHLSSSNNHRLNTLRRLLAAAEQAPQPERGLRRRPSTEARKYCSGRSQKNP